MTRTMKVHKVTHENGKVEYRANIPVYEVLDLIKSGAEIKSDVMVKAKLGDEFLLSVADVEEVEA